MQVGMTKTRGVDPEAYDTEMGHIEQQILANVDGPAEVANISAHTVHRVLTIPSCAASWVCRARHQTSG
jgi:hypothetical protein